jgi:hypothetical protein
MFTELELVEDSCLSCRVEAEHEASGLSILEPLLEDPEESAHEKLR